jgi:hypothetical protein
MQPTLVQSDEFEPVCDENFPVLYESPGCSSYVKAVSPPGEMLKSAVRRHWQSLEELCDLGFVVDGLFLLVVVLHRA